MSPDLVPELIPWMVLSLVFLGMLALCWKLASGQHDLSTLLAQALSQLAAGGKTGGDIVFNPPDAAPPKSVPLPAPPPLPKVPVPSPPVPVIAGPFGTAPPWFQWSLHEIGFHETGANQGLDRYIALAHTGANGEPWCAIFANAALESSGITGSRSPSSQSFRSNPAFVQLAGPSLGAICVFWRGSQSSGLGHVGFYRGEDATHVWVLGGNENDMVQIEELAKSSASFGLIGYWWPKSVPLPAIAPVLMPAGSPASIKVPPVSIPTAATPDGSGKQTGITATMFGSLDSGKFQSSAYGGPIIDTAPGIALPFHFPAPRPRVRVTGKSSGLSVDCDIVDVGPWNIKDPYWESGTRPQAETGFDLGQVSNGVPRKTNKAGIDLTLAAAQAIQVDGKGLVDWQFITDPKVT